MGWVGTGYDDYGLESVQMRVGMRLIGYRMKQVQDLLGMRWSWNVYGMEWIQD